MLPIASLGKIIKMSNDPLHGKSLKTIVEQLVDFYGFDTLGELINIKCFKENPSVKSSLTFLRKTDWARKKVEELYVRSLKKIQKTTTK
jgi:uncharacterized protein (DUF2132 family)